LGGVATTERLECVLGLAAASLGLALGLLMTVLTVHDFDVFDPINRHPLLVGLHAAHTDLNAAVGFGRWEPEHLADTSADLRRLAVRYDNAGPILEEAAQRIDDAIAGDDRSAASTAHTIVDHLERRVREQLERERRALRLPAA
jgi:hypothetical protein